MTAIELFLNQPWVARVGWTLVHFLWQGTLLAVLLAAARGLAGRWLTPRARYALACCTLGAMTLAPLVSFLALGRPDSGALPAPVWLVSGAGWERALPWLVAVWFCGATGFSVRLIGGWRLTTRLRTVGVRPAPREWEQALDELIRRMSVSAPARLLISSRVAVPVVVGWLRPLILMPVAALTGLPLEQVRALLAHELAHVLRRDYLVNILQSIAEALLFYHPAVWWVSGQIRAERELCCDDLAVAASGDALTYAYALADLDSARRARLKTALAADGGSLLQRIRRLAGESQPRSHNLPGPGTAWAVGLLWLAAVGAAAMHGAVNPPALPLPSRSDAPPMPLAIPKVAPPVAPGGPAVKVRRAPAAVAALLFDPLFAPLRAQAQNASASPQDKKKLHVSGTILSLTGGPVKKATVRLSLADPPLDQRPTSYSGTTDDGGKFTIEDVQPGNYTLQASKTGFLSNRYGARTPSAPGAIISVAEDADVENLEIKLTPQGTVSGRITDQDGEPVPHAWVFLIHAVYVNGKKQDTHNRVNADSLGVFTFSNVSPGRYVLNAQPIQKAPGLEPGISDLQTYYPSVLDQADAAADAAAIEMRPGARVDGINVRLIRGKSYYVRGKVTFNGAPVTAPLSIIVTNPGKFSSWGCRVRDGSFVMNEQTPGVFTMEVLGGNAPEPLRGLVGRMQFTISDSDVNVVFPLQQGVEVSGRLDADGEDWQSRFSPGGGAPSDASAPIPRPTIRLTSAQWRNGSTSGRANDDGAFQLSPAIPDDYLLDVAGLPKGSYVKSVRYGSGGASQGPLRVESSAAKLEIEISSKGASINGVLRGDKGEPLAGYVVSAWPKTPNLWSASHGVQFKTSDQRGMFEISGLAPGKYYVAAFEEIESGLRQYPGFLVKFADRAESVDLSEGSQATADVKAIPKDVIASQVQKLQ